MNYYSSKIGKYLRTIPVACVVLTAVSLIAHAADIPTPINATVCDLVHRPFDFENKHIRIQGRARFAFEISALVDKTCPADNKTAGMIWLDFDDDSYEIVKYYRGWSLMDFVRASNTGELKGEGPSVAWQTASAVTPLDPAKRDAFFQVLKERPARMRDKDVVVTIIGRFDFAGGGLLIYTRDKHLLFKSGFGHINGYSGRIVVESIELLKDKK